ncbi:interleukin-3-like [Manis javanica]|uniref:interleukin-3-like n=1 Tax=Manis javanica TaxID=9974 RepID=UPI003C6D927C
MSSLPILHFLLLLLRLQVPQAQGFPTLRPDQYSVIVTEILRALNESPLASQVSSWDKYGQGGCCQPTGLTQRAVSLSAPTNRALLRPNLDAFLEAASNLYGNDSQIRKNLKVCEAVEDFWDPHHHPCLGPAPSPGDEGSRASSFPGELPQDAPAGAAFSHDLTPACHPPSNLASSNATFIVSSQADQIRIEESNKGDFQRKLKQYLVTINSFLRDRNRH